MKVSDRKKEDEMERSCIRYVQEFTGDGRTKKQYRRECDINDIVARAKKLDLWNLLKRKKEFTWMFPMFPIS